MMQRAAKFSKLEKIFSGLYAAAEELRRHY